MSCELLPEIGRDWFGYGSWSAPYWFIGPEPGMLGNGTDDLDTRTKAWMGLGGGEVVDCRAHHLAFGCNKWFRPGAPIQPTWGKLIRLLLTFTGEAATNGAIREYQRTRWGSVDGDTCVIELSSQAAHSLRVERDRSHFLDERIATIQTRIRESGPIFVVMYGSGSRAAFESIAAQQFDRDGFAAIGATSLLHTPHPVAHGSSNAQWEEYGRQLRNQHGAVLTSAV
jgi:hypothetical protein